MLAGIIKVQKQNHEYVKKCCEPKKTVMPQNYTQENLKYRSKSTSMTINVVRRSCSKSTQEYSKGWSKSTSMVINDARVTKWL